jgi:hypothetical protein
VPVEKRLAPRRVARRSDAGVVKAARVPGCANLSTPHDDARRLESGSLIRIEARRDCRVGHCTVDWAYPRIIERPQSNVVAAAAANRGEGAEDACE